MQLLTKIYKITEKIKRRLISIWISYLAGISVDYISDANSFKEVLQTALDTSKLSVRILWIGLLILIIVWVFNSLFDSLSFSNKSEIKFRKIMDVHTCDILRESHTPGYSWGYNKNIVNPRNPTGWKPNSIFIDTLNSRLDSTYVFPDEKHSIIDGYSSEKFIKYSNENSKIKIIQNRGDDRDRYAVLHIEANMNRRDKKVEIRLQKTRWSQLQFSWDMIRRLDKNNQPIEPSENNSVITKLYKSVLTHSQKEFLINSFCLHLIMISSNGKVILSKISKVKSNDYPSTWAATIGEQIEREDFIDVSTGETRSDFVSWGVKRALMEEFDINENEITERGENELDSYVDMNSLRVLSVDFEGDIYNIALTCAIKLKINAAQLQSAKGILIDGNENSTEFKECSPKEVREILLDYPKNSSEYHPSTYLRLLMYHLYTERTKATYDAFVHDSKKYGKLKNAS